MKKEVKAIILDLGGVILNIDYQRTIRAFELLLKNGANVEAFYNQAKQNQVFDLFEKGEISAADFRTDLKKIFGLQLSDHEIDAAWNAMLLDLPLERLTFVSELRKKYPVYLLSNTNEIHYQAFRKNLEETFDNPSILEDFFDKTYYSHLIKQRKPTAAAFNHVLDDNQLNAYEVVFVDDSAQHIEGAMSLGIDARLLVNSSLSTLCQDLL
jgi:putative hydrolase of the HAD superfamily